MTRVNLLPPEVLEKRQSERRIVWVVAGALVLAVVLAGIWGIGSYMESAKRDELAAIQQQTAAIQAQADQLAVFEQRASEMEERKATVLAALGGRVDWAKLLDELSLVLPSDLWVQTMTLSEVNGVSMSGYAVDSPTDIPDSGHKAIAKGLVRIADLEGLHDVWLGSSTKTEFNEQDAIQFTITAKIAPPEAEGESE
jgi:Tfp pilus assembly protein PilN